MSEDPNNGLTLRGLAIAHGRLVGEMEELRVKVDKYGDASLKLTEVARSVKAIERYSKEKFGAIEEMLIELKDLLKGKKK